VITQPRGISEADRTHDETASANPRGHAVPPLGADAVPPPGAGPKQEDQVSGWQARLTIRQSSVTLRIKIWGSIADGS